MPLAGRQLTISAALACCRSVGFGGRDELIDAVCVMSAESARFTAAYHENLAEDGETVDSTDRGVFQLNDKWHSDIPDEAAYRAKPNARYAYGMFKASKFNPWMAYKSGAHEKFKAEVTKVYDRGTWRLRVPLWKGREG